MSYAAFPRLVRPLQPTSSWLVSTFYFVAFKFVQCECNGVKRLKSSSPQSGSYCRSTLVFGVTSNIGPLQRGSVNRLKLQGQWTLAGLIRIIRVQKYTVLFLMEMTLTCFACYIVAGKYEVESDRNGPLQMVWVFGTKVLPPVIAMCTMCKQENAGQRALIP